MTHHDYGPGFWIEEGWTCPECGQVFTAVLCEDDLEEPVCEDGTLRCPPCLEKLFAGLTREDVIRAAKKL